MNLKLNINEFLFFPVFLIVLGVFFWLIVRVKKTEFICQQSKSYRGKKLASKNQNKSPPLLPFLCFLFATMVFVFFNMKPKKILLNELDQANKKIHIFVDMSPSVSANISLEQYIKQVSELWSSLSNNFEISLSTSNSNLIYSPNNEIHIEKILLSLGFHEAGIYIGEALRKQVTEIEKIDQLIVVSDADLGSWDNFNWRYLQQDLSISFLDISNDTKTNTYFFLVANIYQSCHLLLWIGI